MKRMKKSVAMYLATAALCFMFLFLIKVDSEAYDQSVSGISSNGRNVTISLTYNYGYMYDVILYDRTGKEIGRVTTSQYATFNNACRKNKVYYYKSRMKDANGNPVTDWSKKVAFTTISGSKYKFKIKSKKKRTVSVKVPKIKGVASYTIYVSPNYSSGYKKAKTAKSGKTVTISKYGGSKFSLNRLYYIKIVPKVKKKAAQGLIGIGSFRFYLVYR